MGGENPMLEADLSPRENPELRDQVKAEDTLLGAWRSGRLAHAWLLTGPRGIGKATLAYRFARFVLADGRMDGGANGGGLFDEAPNRLAPDSLALAPDHPTFRRVASGGHADLKTLVRGPDPKTGRMRTVITVDQVRAASKFLSLTPAEGGWRVVIVDAADDMNHNGANALLKTLEEPHARVLLLLIAHAPGALLPTVRSRCRTLALQPLPNATVAALLTERLPEIAPEAAAALAHLADGSIGRALDLAAAGGLDLYTSLLQLLADLPRVDAARLHALADRLSRKGAEAEAAYRTFTELMQWWLGKVVRLCATGSNGSNGAASAIAPGDAGNEAVAGEGASIARLGQAGNLDRWLAVWDNLATSFAREAAVNLDRKQTLLSAVFALQAAARR